MSPRPGPGRTPPALCGPRRFIGLAPTIGAAALATCARVPDAEAVVDLAAGTRTSYAQLRAGAARVAAGGCTSPLARRAVVVPRPGTTVDPAALVAFARERLADFKIPQYLVIRAEPLPRNAAGKVDKPRLRTESARAPISLGPGDAMGVEGLERPPRPGLRF